MCVKGHSETGYVLTHVCGSETGYVLTHVCGRILAVRLAYSFFFWYVCGRILAVRLAYTCYQLVLGVSLSERRREGNDRGKLGQEGQ